MKKNCLKLKNLDYKDIERISIIFGKMCFRKNQEFEQISLFHELENLQYSKCQINDLMLLKL